MKDNIDLTIDRKFSRRSRSLASFDVFEILFSENRELKFPWSKKMKRLSSLDNSSNENPNRVLTGNKQDREEKKKAINYINGYDCECCGKILTKKLWLRKPYNLCERCDYSLEQDHRPSSYFIETRMGKARRVS